jgi:undecaprenyl-diphosphatase
MSVLTVLILAVVRGICELLPVSSSAHVILAEQLMSLDPSTPEMTLLLVMLHTGTMLAVIVYFWHSWRARYFASMPLFWSFAKDLIVATGATGVIGLVLMQGIELLVLGGSEHAEIEQLFGNTTIIASCLTAAGIMIILSAERAQVPHSLGALGYRTAALIGVVQGICLPFRGFYRSASTISTGLFLGLNKERAEDFSFALAVVLTPAVIAKEGYRFLKAHTISTVPAANLVDLLLPNILGMIFSFVAGMVALRWLLRWLEKGRWHLFGYYCLFAAIVIFSVG